MGLQQAGHRVRLATHADFEPLVRSHGLDFFPVEGSSRALHTDDTGQKMIRAGGNPFAFLYQFGRMRQPLMRQMMERTFEASADADLILGSGTAYLISQAISEKLGIPFMAAFVLPFAPSRFLTNGLFAPPPSWLPFPGVYNFLSHVLAAEFLWQTLGSSINEAREEVLGLPRLPFLGPVHLSRKVPALHCFSPIVVPEPSDWGVHCHITGYWFLDQSPMWKPPAALNDFLRAGTPPIYVGFGSMPDENPDEITELVIKALSKCRQRGILATGWGGMAPTNRSDHIFLAESAPHDWLFSHVAAVVHHGGSGTTGAGLRAGVPSIIIPFMADQPFWGHRVFELGVGPRPIPRKELSVDRLAHAIHEAVGSQAMRRRAADLGRRIRAEDGVGEAIDIIHRYVGIAGHRGFREVQDRRGAGSRKAGARTARSAPARYRVGPRTHGAARQVAGRESAHGGDL
jgi:UDP:flavonoid glycosyltransferase YjiC (YdhE family)